ncbi:MAG: SpoIID/LytB domain-containing protein [Lachnospiraceae bacterium]|nr:SpoIID/LytB domain-containing protein [Lachnospiraceae bacterium]
MKKRDSVKKRDYILAVLALLGLVLVILFIQTAAENKVILEYSSEYVAMAELPSQLSFTYYEEEEWKDQLKEINGGKNLNGKLTFGKLEQILEKLSVKEYVTYPEEISWKKVSRPQWNEVYEQILDLLDPEGSVAATNLVFLTEDAEKEESGQRLTQRGFYQVSAGVDYFHVYDMYQVYVKENRIIGVSSVCKGPLTLKNVFVHSAKEEQAEILYEHQKITLNIEGLTEKITDTVCDVEWKENKVTAIYKKEEMISGKVLSFNDKQIEISGYGTLEYEGALKIYKTYGTLEELDESKLVIGNLQADFVVAEKKVCGIILKEPAAIEIIRVLLLNEGNGNYHENPVFTADTASVVTVGDQTKEIEADQPVVVSELFQEKTDYVKISPKEEGGKIYFADRSGKRVSLGYRGKIEIRKYPEGYGVVNEISLEQYLYGVVPSEMPSSYEREALCVQAVCARSYACIQLMKNDYAALGAHVDDSTNYQVFNKQEETPQTNLAVDDTVGEVIKYQGEIAEAYFFSTSCGYTGDMGLWNVDGEEKYGYLQESSLLADGTEADVSSEEGFAEFIKNNEITAFDSDSPYFRWSADLAVAEKENEINAAIRERAKANAGNVQFLRKDGAEGSASDLAKFGKIKEISVGERGAGGGIRTLCITYEKGSVTLFTEYNMRYVLGAAAVKVTNKNGETIDMRLLPSAYCALVPAEKGYEVYGGGYGHGIGMSQNGSNGMAKEGMNYVEILMKFYHDISIENIYNEE